MVFTHMWVPDLKKGSDFGQLDFRYKNSHHFQAQFTVTETLNWWQTRELKPGSHFSFHFYSSGTSAILFLFTKANPLTVGRVSPSPNTFLIYFGEKTETKAGGGQQQRANSNSLDKSWQFSLFLWPDHTAFPSVLLLAVGLLPNATSSAFAEWVMRSRGYGKRTNPSYQPWASRRK